MFNELNVLIERQGLIVHFKSSKIDDVFFSDENRTLRFLIAFIVTVDQT